MSLGNYLCLVCVSLCNSCFRVSSSVACNFVLKTDDDCFLNVDRILTVLHKWKDEKRLWWGRSVYFVIDWVGQVSIL